MSRRGNVRAELPGLCLANRATKCELAVVTLEVDIPPLEAHSEPPPYDKTRAMQHLRCLEEELGGLAKLLLESTASSIERMRTGVAAGDFATLRDAAHRAKGSVSFFAADRAYALLAQLEEAAVVKDGDGAARLLASVEIELERLTRALSALR